MRLLAVGTIVLALCGLVGCGGSGQGSTSGTGGDEATGGSSTGGGAGAASGGAATGGAIAGVGGVAAGTGGASGSCAFGQTVCGSGCVSLDSNAANCGSCDNACLAGQTCEAGACSCLPGLTLCEGSCVDTLSSAAHCGGCEIACMADQVCSAGSCGSSCGVGLSQCGTSCVDLTSDPLNCGVCEAACPAGQSCVAAVCTCPVGQTYCNGSCIDTQTDAANCGSCANQCAAGAVCVAGVCGSTGAGGGSSGGAGGGATGGVSNGATGGATSGAGGTATGGAGTGGTGASSTGGVGGNEEYPVPASLADEDGSELWLRYPQVILPGRLAEYQAALTHVVEAGSSATLQAAQDELVQGLSGLTGTQVPVTAAPTGNGAVVLGTPTSSTTVASLSLDSTLSSLGPEGYLVQAVDSGGQQMIVVAANTEIGVLYGSFALLRHLQCHRSVQGLALGGAPKIEHRVLNHWDNLDGSVERGYAGRSLWDWNALPGALSPRYETYARANASIGINGTVLTNVNADAQVLTTGYLTKVAALADVFRPYGITVYLTARFSAPIEIGGQSTADPLDSAVQQWWADKANEIYTLIPDFGGFLVKANSEGQPGPQDYGRTHADGANMLADALASHGGIVMWRAFVYAEDSTVDRIRQAYDEFKPLDGQFSSNVLVQPKNGPLDFQPREPFHPLFGGMPQTPLSLELQITKEYLGEDTHLAYLGTLYEEVLQSDTYASGAGSTVARVIDGSLHGYSTTAIAGVSNVGNDSNWTGSHFNQANWYVFGRMAWDPDLGAQTVADDWIRQTFSNDPVVVAPVTEMMMESREAVVNYMTPLGLAHIMGSDHHYGPGPWIDNLSRAEWNPVYYHRADAAGIGFDRTASGSNAVEQYYSQVGQMFDSRDTVPDEFLLFFHHVGWDEVMSSGRTLWEELVYRYSLGVDTVGLMRDSWNAVQGRIDTQRFNEVADFLHIQHWEARWWRDACLQYFRQFANLGIPSGYAEPSNDLSFYQSLTCPSDVTKPRCPAINTGEPSPAILQ